MEYRHTKPLKTARPSGRRVQRRVKGATKTEKPVEFVLPQPGVQNVSVAGTFNNWDPKATPLTQDAQGVWKATVSLKPGHYQYRFVVDGEWRSDPNARDSVPNEFGSTNAVLAV